MLVVGMAMIMACITASAQDVPGPRDYHITTTLAAGGQSEVTIVSSSTRPAYGAIAQKVQSRIRELSGADVPIVDAADVTTDDLLAGRSAIVLGNLATSRFVEDLYWQWYTITDLWYPGPGGYELRTLHDPYGTGRNVIFVGGSDDDGVAAAAEALCGVLAEGEPLAVGRLMEIKLGENHQMPPEGEYTDPRLRIFNQSFNHRTIHDCPVGYSDASLAGLRYYYNGDEAALDRFREVALSSDFLSDGYHYYSHMHALVWDLIEESPLFSDDDRRAITVRLLAYARGSEGTAGRESLLNDARLHAESKKLLDRHFAMRANCTLTHSRYFNKYWPSEEWELNLDAVRQYFDRLMTSAKGWRDEGNMHTYLECPLMAALIMRDRRIIDSGALRHYAELILMFCNNNGYMTTYGGGYPSGTLRACAALLNEPGLLATLPRNEEAERASGKFPPPYGFMGGQAWDIGLQPEPMEKMVGVYYRPATRWEWEHYQGDFDYEKALDKLCMRSGFGPDDQYLLLDGISVGGGKPNPNRNAILSLGENGQTHILGGARSVVVSREGMGEDEGHLVSLEGIANLPTFGYSHTRAGDHPFSAWDRHIFWRKGAWFVVLDTVTAKAGGRHSMACNWTPQGSLSVKSDTASCSRGDGDARSTVFIKNAEPLRIDRTGNMVRQNDCRQVAPGDQFVATNLIYAVAGDSQEAYSIAKIGPHAAVLSGDEEAYLGIAPEGEFSRGGVDIKGAAFCLCPTSLAVVSGTQIGCDALTVTASEPCSIELQPIAGTVTVECTRALTLSIGNQTHTCEPGTQSFTVPASDADAFAELYAAIESDAAAPKVQPASVVPGGLPEVPVAWTARVGDPNSYACYHLGDINSDGRAETLTGMKDGRVICLDDAGQALWEHKTDGPVRSISHATLDGGAAVIIGSEDEHVYAISADGQTLLWKHRCHVSEERYQAAPWWMMGYKAPVLEVFPFDLDGDGSIEIICGTGGGFVECISGGGELKWKQEFFWGLPNHFGIAPAEDGSKHLIVDAANSASGAWTWRLDDKGNPINKNAFDTGRGSWDSTLVQCSEIADMNGRGGWMALVGRGGAFNELALHDAVSGQRRWVHPMADRVVCVTAVDLDGDGIKEVLAGSTSAWLCAFDLEGESRWAVQLPNQVLAVTGVEGGLLAQCSDGNVYRLSADGAYCGIHAPAAKAPPAYTDHWQFRRFGHTVVVGDRSGTITALRVEN